jgi:hypothetical protein
VFLAPPWGGPSYRSTETFKLDFLKPKNGYVVHIFLFHTRAKREIL